MLERFTVDVLADEVTDTLLEGKPDARLAHRFFRKGRRDGRRAHAHESVARMLRTSVAVCGSKLGEQLLDRDGVLRSRIAQLADQPTVGGGTTSSPEHLAARAGATGRDEEVAGAPPAAELEAALSARRRRRAEERRRQAEAAQASAAAAAEKRRLELRELESDLAALPALYRQRFDSSRETAELFWARYCNGFIQGQSRRGSRSRDVKASVERLDCPPPAFLLDPHSPTTAPAEAVTQGASS